MQLAGCCCGTGVHVGLEQGDHMVCFQLLLHDAALFWQQCRRCKSADNEW